MGNNWKLHYMYRFWINKVNYWKYCRSLLAWDLKKNFAFCNNLFAMCNLYFKKKFVLKETLLLNTSLLLVMAVKLINS